MRGSACELVLEVLWAENGHFDEEQFALDRARFGVIQDGPHGYLLRVRPCARARSVCDVSVGEVG